MNINKLKETPFGVKQAVLLLLAIITFQVGIITLGNVSMVKSMQQELVFIAEEADQELPLIANQSPFAMRNVDVRQGAR